MGHIVLVLDLNHVYGACIIRVNSMSLSSSTGFCCVMSLGGQIFMRGIIHEAYSTAIFKNHSSKRTNLNDTSRAEYPKDDKTWDM